MREDSKGLSYSAQEWIGEERLVCTAAITAERQRTKIDLFEGLPKRLAGWTANLYYGPNSGNEGPDTRVADGGKSERFNKGK